MANDFQVAVGKIFAQGLVALREHAAILMAVNRDFSDEVKQRGDTIDVTIPSAATVQDVVPSPGPVTGANSAPTKVQIPLDRWKKTDMFLTDKEVAEIANFRPGAKNQQISEHIKKLVNQVANDMYSEYKGVFGFTGTPQTTPFGSGVETKSATNLRTVLNKQLAPLDPRFAIVDPDAEGAALSLRAFQDASFRGDVAGIRDGQIGRKLGFAWLMDQLVPTHTAGTITTGLVAKSATAQAVGDKTIVCTTAASTGACDLKEGDIITFAGDPQTYVLTADAVEASASTDVTLNINPGLKVALSGDEAVTVKGSHVVNLGFHRDAFALAIRPLGTPDGFQGGNVIMSAQDPLTGIPLRLEVSRQNKQNLYQWDILYGVKLVRPELAARLAG